MSIIGTYPDMPNAEYHGNTAIGSSGIKELQQSPLHYWAKYLNPARERKEPTPAMKIGTAWHAAVFEPGKFASGYVEIPEGLNRTTKEGKALWADILATGKEPMTKADMDRIKAMARSANEHPQWLLIQLQKGGAAETSFFWADPETGAHCKIRPDYYVPPCEAFPNGLLVDGKTGEDMSPEGFAKYAWNWELHIQAAYYSDGFQMLHGLKEPPEFMWLAQEKDAPYATAMYRAQADFLEYGRRLYRPMLELYAQCMKANRWPGYPSEVLELVLPAWAQKEIDQTETIEAIEYV